MKQDNKAIEQYRIRLGLLHSDETFGNNGAFEIQLGCRTLYAIVSDGSSWEHVSVSLKQRCPTWDEMCFVKDLFWADDEVVIQYHPAKNNYVNDYPTCLHLWKPIGVELPMPELNLI